VSAATGGRAGNAGGAGGGRGRGGAPATELVVTDVAPGSPADSAGIKPGQTIAQVEGAPATAVALSDALLNRKAGDKLHLHMTDGAKEWDVEAALEANRARKYTFSSAPDATAAQTAILANWLRAAQ
jgi:predicted metalloprotease with PDZ domain